MMLRATFRAVVAGSLTGVVACAASPTPPLKIIETGDAFRGQQCKAGRPSSEPDLMGWDPASRANLVRLSQAGVVAVRYRAKGCEVDLEVLPNCIGSGGYGYSAYSARDSRVVRNDHDLYGALPIGAARLAGKLNGGRALRTDYVLVGVQSFPEAASFRAETLHGPTDECERATHIVGRIFVGGFAMVAGERREIEGAVDVFGSGAGTSDSSATEHVASEGNAKACEAALQGGQPSPLCSVPLRIALVPIPGRESPLSTDGNIDVAEVFRPAADHPQSCAPSPGTPSESVPTARRAFEEKRWSEAEKLFDRIAIGESGDDQATRQIADYARAIALVKLGRESDAVEVLEAIAKERCHVRQIGAQRWLRELGKKGSPQ